MCDHRDVVNLATLTVADRVSEVQFRRMRMQHRRIRFGPSRVASKIYKRNVGDSESATLGRVKKLITKTEVQDKSRPYVVKILCNNFGTFRIRVSRIRFVFFLRFVFFETCTYKYTYNYNVHIILNM